MGDFLNKGNAGFQEIRKGTYVDKSGLIAFINNTIGTTSKLTCVSRPRRFGKSFAAKMLCAYYDKSCDSRSLFEDLEIAKTPDFLEHLNKYDVIYIDMTTLIGECECVKDSVKYMQKVIVEDLSKAYPQVEVSPILSKMLLNIKEATGNKFIFIIDEWDALFREARDEEETQKEYIQFLRVTFKGSRTAQTIEAAYITGILPIKKYGTQSAMTDFLEYTMLEPEPLEQYVGFTEQEVQELCSKSELKFSDVQHWYDGYSVGNNVHVYNPKSVIEALTRGKIRNYWTKTETYEALKIYIDMNFDGLKETIVQMLGGAHCLVNTIKFQNDMTNVKSRDDVLTLLVHLGYLAYDADEKKVYIPNEEIRQEFISVVEDGSRKELAKLIKTSDRLLAATLEGDEEFVAETIEEQGYADVVYLPKKGSELPIMVVELKWNKTAAGAIEQIKEKKYPQVLESYGSDILLVGINYDKNTKKHSCVIEEYTR